MSNEEKLATQATKILYKYGQKGLDAARKAICEEKMPHQPLQEASEYFMACFEDVLHPALLALACEAVGGKAEDTVELGAALVLLAGGADLHDDIIDGSTVKDGKATVLGRYGKDLTILAGDALLFEGFHLLQKACEKFPAKQRQAVMDLVIQAFFKISSVEAKDAALRGRTDSAEELFAMIKSKSAVTEATMKIGAMIGGGTEQEIKVLRSFGRTFSVLFTARDEFIDTFEIDEVVNRYRNECLPLPVLATYQDPEKAEKIRQILAKDAISESDVKGLVDLVMDSPETGQIRKQLLSLVNTEEQSISTVKGHKDDFNVLLQAMIEDL